MKQYIVIDTEKMKEFFFGELPVRGYGPTEEEVETMVNITFDYLIDIGIIEDFEEY